MKALFGFMIISVLLLASCSTSQYTSSAYDDEVYGGSSSPEMKVMVTEDNSNYRTPRYAEKRKTYSDNNRTIYVDRTREDESSRKAAQEYYKKDTVYYEGDSVIYIEEVIEEEPYYEYDYNDYGFSYSSRINSFYNPSWRYNYHGYYNPYYYSYDPYYYSTYPGWSFNFGWGMSIGYYSPNAFFNNYWDNYYGYGHGYYNYGYYNNGNYAMNHHNSNNNSRYYGHRKNRGRNAFDSNQTATAGRGQRSSSVSRGSAGSVSRGSAASDTQVNSKRGSRVIDKSTNRNKTISQKNTTNNTYTQKRAATSRKRIIKPTGINPRSREKSIVRYRKPKTYTTPGSRSANTSREYQLPQTQTRRSANGTRTVRRVVTNPSRTKSYSTPTRSRNYSTPTRSSSQRYKSPTRSSGSKSYSTPSRSSKSRSSGSSSRSVSSPSRSSSSGSSSSRSSGGSSRGGGRKR